MNRTRVSSLVLCILLGVFLSMASWASQTPAPQPPTASTADFLASLANPPQIPAGLGQIGTPKPKLAGSPCTTALCPNPHDGPSCDNDCACIPVFSCNVSTCTTNCGCKFIPSCAE